MNMTETNPYLAHLDTEQVNEQSIDLDALTGAEIAGLMNRLDSQIAAAVEKAVPVIGRVIDEIALRMGMGGRLFYIGAGTSGRLGVLDASECPPTFGVPDTLVQGVIAGGDHALRYAVEGAEDDGPLGRGDLIARSLSKLDSVVAISASGFAAYCARALDYAKEIGALAVCLACNENTALAQHADLAIEIPTGPEALMGSTRLKAGTATKMALNMISTGVMVRTGRVYRNLMVDLSVSNDKLSDRAIRIICHATGIPAPQARVLLGKAEGSVKTAIVMQMTSSTRSTAQEALNVAHGWVSAAIDRLNRM